MRLVHGKKASDGRLSTGDRGGLCCGPRAVCEDSLVRTRWRVLLAVLACFLNERTGEVEL
jgi:hypothetical protein